MSFFRRNKNEPMIPPVQSSQPAADPYASGAQSGNKAGGGSDPYARAKPAAGGDPYARAKPAAGTNPYAESGGDPYAKEAVNPADAARNELLGGYVQTEAKPARKYGYEGRENEEDFDEEEEIEGIKQDMRAVKNESLASTRNALRLAREAEENARGTMAKLADQSERIANSERYLDMAKANNQRAEDKANELKQLNRSIFRPVVVWNKEAKRQAEEDKIDKRHAMERADRNAALGDISDTRRRLNDAANPSPYGDSRDRAPMPGEALAKKEARARYQFDASASDDELEDELDDNLNETLEVTKRLKNLATAMGDEVSGQNQRLTRVTGKTEDLEFGLMKNTEKLKRIK